MGSHWFYLLWSYNYRSHFSYSLLKPYKNVLQRLTKVLQQQIGFTFKIQVVKYCRVHYFSQWPRSCWVFSLIVKSKNFFVNIFLPKKSLGPTVDGNYPLCITFYLPSSYINYFFNCKFSFYEVSTYTKTHSIRLYLWTLDINKKVNGSSQQTKHPEQKKVCCQFRKDFDTPNVVH